MENKTLENKLLRIKQKAKYKIDHANSKIEEAEKLSKECYKLEKRYQKLISLSDHELMVYNRGENYGNYLPKIQESIKERKIPKEIKQEDFEKICIPLGHGLKYFFDFYNNAWEGDCYETACLWDKLNGKIDINLGEDIAEICISGEQDCSCGIAKIFNNLLDISENATKQFIKHIKNRTINNPNVSKKDNFIRLNDLIRCHGEDYLDLNSIDVQNNLKVGKYLHNIFNSGECLISAFGLDIKDEDEFEIRDFCTERNKYFFPQTLTWKEIKDTDLKQKIIFKKIKDIYNNSQLDMFLHVK